ncbi:hypothetical protein NY2A_b755R [Paramecium bursaria Chlorella virus NY2A]|uniref:Uncharacterized protein b755R n=1 Tax=Paramecium bursaria Chlorella virus NY2A TaxID=46021 RepID=A7IXT0_PBCVN|nr:hypothetical protein NY2A_b755R [Paramecium bursaria Chlorella virus NY2A]ABT15154.1 hypothetical protein NY2A_b755R [Paramecium bursaria Chlorella virus NY2A]
MINFANCSVVRSYIFPCFFALHLYVVGFGLFFVYSECHISSLSGYSNVVRYTACNTNVLGSMALFERLQLEQHATQFSTMCPLSLSSLSIPSAMSPQ